MRRLVLAGLAALTGLVGYAVFSEAAQSHALDSRVHSLTVANSALQQQISQRRLQIGEAGNSQWLQEQARKLGFVFPGETLFIFTAPGAALPASGGVNAILPNYAPSPSASPGSSPVPVPPPTSHASPTPLVFVMPTPSPR